MTNNWNSAIYLLNIAKNKKDNDGFFIATEEKSQPIPANILGITRTEAEHANQLGYTADFEVEIMSANYDGEKVLEDEQGKRYRIRRTYPKSSEILILICSDISKGK